MFKNILVPVDLAHLEKGTALIDRVKQVAGRHDGKLTLLNVVPEIPGFVIGQLPKGVYEKMMSDAEAALQDLVKKHGLAASTEIKIERGHPAHQILHVATKTHADLILVASHQPGLSDYLLGSTAGKVVRHAQCSVLVVR